MFRTRSGASHCTKTALLLWYLFLACFTYPTVNIPTVWIGKGYYTKLPLVKQ